MVGGKKQCAYSGKPFVPDRRVGNRQRACSAFCQKKRKKDNNKAFARSNPNYWKGRYEVVKDWRLKNPDYQKQWRLRTALRQQDLSLPSEIQAEQFGKALDAVQKNILVLRKIQAEMISKATLSQSDKQPLCGQDTSPYCPREGSRGKMSQHKE